MKEDGILQDYRTVEPGVWVKRASQDSLAAIDSLVLDIDGVILDVLDSFRVAISVTTEHYFSKVLGWPGQGPLITSAETEWFKLCGGFNNDWELTFAVVIFYLARSEQMSTCDLGELAADKPVLQAFTEWVHALGGGLSNAEAVALKNLSQAQKKQVKERWNTKLITEIFQEYYAGSGYCERLYGFKPTGFQSRGLLENETIIVKKELIEPFSPNVAVLTGRTQKEAGLALERASLTELIDDHHVLADGTLRKPDPRTLLVLAEKMGTRAGIYVGDTPDDLETVNRFHELGTPINFFSGIVLREATPNEIFVDGHADVLAQSTDDLLAALQKLKQH